jgi:hypothetical protein
MRVPTRKASDLFEQEAGCRRIADPEARRLLLKEIAGMVRSQLKPKLMLWLCVDALVREKIEVPSYARLTKLILGAIDRRKQELATIFEHALDQDARGLLDGLLTARTN